MHKFCLPPDFEINLCSFPDPIWTFQFEKSTVGWGTTQLSWFGLHIKSQKSLEHQSPHSPISRHWFSPFKISPKSWKMFSPDSIWWSEMHWPIWKSFQDQSQPLKAVYSWKDNCNAPEERREYALNTINPSSSNLQHHPLIHLECSCTKQA